MRGARSLLATVILGIMVTGSPAGAAPNSALYDAIRQADLRVATVGERLAIANLPLCRKTAYRTGLLLQDIRQYAADEAGARHAFGFEQDISVEAVVPGSGADKAGIVAGLGIVSLDGRAVEGLRSVGTDEDASFTRMGGVLEALDAATADGGVDIIGVQAGKPVRARIDGTPGCPSWFQLKLGGGGAEADGLYVQVASGAYELAKSDDDLAILMAHEFAHNVLEHRDRLDAKNVSRGMLAQFGKNASRIRATEAEADRLAVYLMLNAGYDPQAALPFMDRLLKKYDLGFLSDSSHPRRGERMAMFRTEIAAAKALRARTPEGQVLIPDFARQPFAPLP